MIKGPFRHELLSMPNIASFEHQLKHSIQEFGVYQLQKRATLLHNPLIHCPIKNIKISLCDQLIIFLTILTIMFQNVR